MLLVLASQADDAAARFVERCGGAGLLLTCRDLSLPGWRISTETLGRSTIVAGGRRVKIREVDGVLTLLPGIIPQELVHIVPQDRAYVAAEMTAFLLYWLSELPCPVLNRPQPGCLSGPPWAPEQWLRTAADLGIPVVPFRRSTRPLRPRPAIAEARWRLATRTGRAHNVLTCTVIARRCLGTADTRLREWALTLARAAGTDLLSVTFLDGSGGYLLADAHAFPDVSAAAVAAGVAEYFGIRHLRRGRVPGARAASGAARGSR